MTAEAIQTRLEVLAERARLNTDEATNRANEHGNAYDLQWLTGALVAEATILHALDNVHQNLVTEAELRR